MNIDDWQQHYPTYKFKDRDVLLEEYKVAADNVQSQERIFLNAVNITLVVLAVLGSLVFGKLNELLKNLSGLFLMEGILIVFIIFTCFFSIVTLMYFADRQKSIIFDFQCSSSS